ncbi:uncharacterized protein BYT42DRAFT_589461 [Radiomyces spectabilis]|uniref:uncharacterized protein n=1 Tax=Radiomyces spectabilis TaxID=64574 RepID=UPI0022206AE7|nr:uncharacterized protein BYT42DRAFT_589461 [Radiomyces spectabilis]KAI8365287.1 hypothetical protein BYT42DRAFT_589461 [Radiomyces spectabilis]
MDTPEFSLSKRHRPKSPWRHHFAWLESLIHPSVPVLPQDTRAPPQPWFLRLPLIRYAILVYIIFAVALSATHVVSWCVTHRSLSSPRVFKDWIPKRTYAQDEPFSLLDGMPHGLKMAKMLDKSDYESTTKVQPYWLRTAQKIHPEGLSLMVMITPESWSDLVRLTDHWQGPISATLHIGTEEDGVTIKDKIRHAYQEHASRFQSVDVHLIETTSRSPSVLLSRNVERNIARLYARTHYICELPSNVIPATDLRRMLDSNKNVYGDYLRNGDMLILPLFVGNNRPSLRNIPNHKSRLLDLVRRGEMGLLDPTFELNQGPTNLSHWEMATQPYIIEKYDLHYEPIVIQSKFVQPWCAERFLDRKSACLFSNHLAGGDFWVLPQDFVVQVAPTKPTTLSSLDAVIEDRLYSKFFWEQCVHHGRQLEALGLWYGPRSKNIHTQCSRVIKNWGRGLIGKAE